MPNINKIVGGQPEFRALTQALSATVFENEGETSGKEYVRLSIADPKFGPKKLDANLGKAAGQDDEHLYAVLWMPAD